MSHTKKTIDVLIIAISNSVDRKILRRIHGSYVSLRRTPSCIPHINFMFLRSSQKQTKSVALGNPSQRKMSMFVEVNVLGEGNGAERNAHDRAPASRISKFRGGLHIHLTPFGL